MTIYVVNEHFSLNKILLLMIGLWPFHRSKLNDFHLFLFLSILVSFIIFQFTIFLTTESTFNLVIKILSINLCFLIFLITYNSFCINAHIVRCLLEELQYVCNELKDNSEIAIFREYGNNTKRFTTMITLFTMLNLIILILLPTWSRIRNIILSINSSQLYRTRLVMTEYFVDQEKCFYINLLHTDAAICIGAIALISTGTLLVGLMKHICGMFEIVSYRIEQAMMIKMCKSANLANEIVIYKEIARAVDIHQKAMELCNIFKSNFEGSFFFLIVIGVLCLSLNLYQLSQTILLENSIEDIVIHSICIVVIFAYNFIGNYVGQEITDQYNHIFTITYSVKWYIAPLRIQKMILFLLQKGVKPFYVVLGGIVVVSMESAGMLISASISYFAVLFSISRSTM